MTSDTKSYTEKCGADQGELGVTLPGRAGGKKERQSLAMIVTNDIIVVMMIAGCLMSKAIACVPERPLPVNRKKQCRGLFVIGALQLTLYLTEGRWN